LQLVSIALISPMKNILPVLQALEKVKANVSYDIFGAVKDHDYWLLCKQQMKLLPTNISVVWHGEIRPEEIVGALSSAHVFILPSKSENFGHAIYEALSAGRPVITSHNTPWQQLMPAKAGINVTVDGGKELMDAISFFAAMDNNEMAHWSSKSREYAEQVVDVDSIKKQYEEMFFGDAQPLPSPGA
ncbi:MAG: glycosyltransferase, partial [Ginsengibacter sp.]